MGLSLTILGCSLMFTAPSFIPEHVTVGFFVAVIGVIISHTGIPTFRKG